MENERKLKTEYYLDLDREQNALSKMIIMVIPIVVGLLWTFPKSLKIGPLFVLMAY